VATRSAGGPSAKSALLWLAIGYPILVHIAILSHDARLIGASVGWLAVLMLWPALRSGRLVAWIALGAIIAALWTLSRHQWAMLPLFAPPVLITGFVAWAFGRTLRPGEIPLIERIARALREPGASWSDERRQYARRWTATWTVVTAVLCVLNLSLALLARPSGLLLAAGIEPAWSVSLATWSTFANVINYVVLGAMFVVEYASRRRRFSDDDDAGFVSFIRRVVRLGPHLRLHAPDRET
jgi:uncharacterized membrane protein